MSDQTSLWIELQRLCEASDHEKALKTCEKRKSSYICMLLKGSLIISPSNHPLVLKATPGDIDAFHVKITALIHLDRFQDALFIINGVSKDIKHTFVFEEAYCLYRAEDGLMD